jgi:hypothetical protein
MRLAFTEEKILSAKTALEVIFPNKKTQAAAHLFIQFLKENKGRVSKSQVSRFADKLQRGELLFEGKPLKYSRRNFYLTILRNLVAMGFIQRNVPTWDPTRRTTRYVYAVNIFDIPKKPPSVGFWRLAYYICKKWNLLFEETESSK